jgi:oligoendopeptidase F
MGHSIHSYYARKYQPYVYGDYTLFVAEVASTTNEKLLIHHQIKNEKDPLKKLYLVNQELEQVRTTVFRQLMFAEFEKITHETIQQGTPMTGEDFNTLWLELNRKYFGEGIVIDKEIEIEWARIPHFYSDFYVYQYATGYAAASAFAESILSEGEEAVKRYLSFLKTGGSNYPVETLQAAGVDMTSKKPLEATVRRFNELLDMLEEFISNR